MTRDETLYKSYLLARDTYRAAAPGTGAQADAEALMRLAAMAHGTYLDTPEGRADVAARAAAAARLVTSDSAQRSGSWARRSRD